MNRTGNRKQHDAILHDLATFARQQGYYVEAEKIVLHGVGQAGVGRRTADLVVGVGGQVFVVEVKRELIWPYQLRAARSQVCMYRDFLAPAFKTMTPVVVCPSVHPRVPLDGTPEVFTPEAFKAFLASVKRIASEAVA